MIANNKILNIKEISTEKFMQNILGLNTVNLLKFNMFDFDWVVFALLIFRIDKYLKFYCSR